MILEELPHVIPSFVARVDRPERGGEWISFLQARRAATEIAVARLGLDRREPADAPSVELVHVDGTEADLLASSLYESTGVGEAEIRRRVDCLDPLERAELIGELIGERATAATGPAVDGRRSATASRSSPTTAASATFSATACSPASGSALPKLGAGVPAEVTERGGRLLPAGARGVAQQFERLESLGLAEAAPYALCLGYRIRFVLDLNAREAMHLWSCARAARATPPTARSPRPCTSGLPRYTRRSPGHEPRRLLTEPRLERIMSEIRAHRKRIAAGI